MKTEVSFRAGRVSCVCVCVFCVMRIWSLQPALNSNVFIFHAVRSPKNTKLLLDGV